jgi:hypothetical protein
MQEAGRRVAASRATGLLLATATGHDAPLAAILLIAILVIGALVAIALVSLAHRDDRVDAIRAAAEVLTALLPWPGRRRTPGKPGGRPGRTRHKR